MHYIGSMTLEDLAQKLLAHAKERYEEGGWDVLVECYTVEDIVQEWRNNVIEYKKALPKTLKSAIASFQVHIDHWAEQEADAINSAF